MIDNFDRCLDLVLTSEGGYSNDARDPGGVTMFGVTQAAWQDWVKRPVSEIEMRSLTRDKIAPLYPRRFWEPIKGNQLPLGLDYAVFDCSVNSGPGRAVKLLQTALGVTADGALGSRTLDAIANIPVEGLIHDFCEERINFMRGLSTFAAFGTGWTRRVAEVQETAVNMAKNVLELQ